MPSGIRSNEVLKNYTTLHIGGTADYTCEVTSEEELEIALRYAKQATIPVLILGGGSNVLISDEGFRGLVIIIKIKKREYNVHDTTVTVTLGAGEVLDDVVKWTVEKCWWGLENLSAIPGTVGATPVQNVGAYGVEIADLVTQVTAIHRDTAVRQTFTPSQCQFSYRDSFFKTKEGRQWVITEVTLRLTTIPQPRLAYADLVPLVAKEKNLTPQTVRDLITTVRSQKFPDWSVVGTAGSLFKNPIITKEHFESLKKTYGDIPGYMQPTGEIKVSLGYILDKVCGLRGYCEAEVCLFEKQALVLIVKKDATAVSVREFVKNISKKVFEKTNIHIECEVQFV